MHSVQTHELPKAINDKLKEYQAQVLKNSVFEEQKKEALRLWKSKNRKDNSVFVEVRKSLKKIAPLEGCCVYCESNTGAQIEHFRPKSCFPECAFDWENFLPACGECNLMKRDKFRVYVNITKSWHDISAVGTPSDLRFGMPALLNPRNEDTMDLLGIELKDTFLYYSRYPQGTVEYERAYYTVVLLGLNTNETLREMRKNSFAAYISHLKCYLNAAGRHDQQDQIRKTILNIPIASVWWEMKRQSQSKHHELNSIFQQVPEAKLWSHRWIPGHDQEYLNEQASSGGKHPFPSDH